MNTISPKPLPLPTNDLSQDDSLALLAQILLTGGTIPK